MNNRRNFIKKSSFAAAAFSISGLGRSAESSLLHGNDKPFIKDAGIKFAFFMDPASPKVPFAKQLAVNYAVSGISRVEGFRPWEPEPIKATKAAWDKNGIKWAVVEGPPALGTQTKLGLKGRDEEISNFITFMKNLRQHGDVDIICYNWMPVISWSRTNKF